MLMTRRITSSLVYAIAPKGYEAINVLPWKKERSRYYEMSPYYLKTDGLEEQINDGNILFENFWQGSKVFPVVYPIIVRPHYQSDIIWWQWDKKERHIDGDIVLPEYKNWRQSIWQCKNPIRYPNSFNRRSECAFLLLNDRKLDYITSRKDLYIKEYSRLIKKLLIYHTLLNKLRNGQKLCIFEIDVPTNDFYPTIENLTLLENDKKKPYGHGLCLAMSLLKDLG